MKRLKQLLYALLAVTMLLMGFTTAFAAVDDTGFSDVAVNAWYTDAVQYVRDNGLMSGASSTTFLPNANASRAMLATILYRASGSPTTNQTVSFTDVAADVYYKNAVAWASEKNIISGYGNGLFGSDNPVNREQIATILWRYAGSPATDTSQDFADEGTIAAYAVAAVDWARTNEIVSGKEGNRFDPQGNVTRAEVAKILWNYMNLEQNGGQIPDANTSTNANIDIDTNINTNTNGSNILVVYYSATGSTKAVADTIADTLDADLFEINPTEPYTNEDLNWTDSSSRVSREHDDHTQRTVELTSMAVENWDTYDTVFIGYPIWWGIAAWPINGFITANDFTGKTVIPFCTSSSSGIGESGKLLAELAKTGNWQNGQRFSSGVSQRDVQAWVNGLDLNTSVSNQASKSQTSRFLVVYFSMPETTNPTNMTQDEEQSTVVIEGKILGNTQYMAQVIAETAGADIFRIEPETPYPTDHDTLVDMAANEQDQDARPTIRDSVDNMQEYDTIFIGYPIWWSDMPMILYSFFDQYDLSGKIIVPFSTHGGSSFAGTPAVIESLEPNATLLDGLTISRDRIQDAKQQIVDWVNGLAI